MLLIASHVLVLTCCFPKKTQLRELPKNPYSSNVLSSAASSLMTYQYSSRPKGRATARCTGPKRFSVIDTPCQQLRCPGFNATSPT